MCCKNFADIAPFFNSMEKLCQSGELTKNVGLKIFNALVDYDVGEYDKVVESLFPIRQKIYQIGGSHAQVFVYRSCYQCYFLKRF